MKVIPITKGFVVWVDDEDYAELSKYRWAALKTHPDHWTAKRATRLRKEGGFRWVTIYMHRVIMDAKPGELIDHKEKRDGERVIDNRRSNLRRCSPAQNTQNARKYRGNRKGNLPSSIFKGVSIGPSGKWEAFFYVKRRRIHLGTFRDEAMAAYAYDLAAVRGYGEFAYTNFPVPGSRRWLYGEAA